MSSCRSCGAEILWAVSAGSGKRVPLDAEPTLSLEVEPALFVLTSDPAVDDAPLARTLPRDQGRLVAYRSHFATCPNAAQHRKGAAANG